MTQQRDMIQQPAKAGQRTAFVAGLSVIGGISILSNGLVLTPAAVAQEVTEVPSAQELLAPALEAPAPAAAPSPAPAPPEPAVVERPAVQVEAPAKVQPEISISEPEAVAPTIAAPELIAPARTESADQPYIDTTDYSVGATYSPEQAGSVIFAERSTGCQVTVERGGAVPGSICATKPGSVQAVAASGPRRSGNFSTVNLGMFSLSSGGVRLNSATAQDFYNLSTRPSALAGNGNARLMFPLSIPAAISSAFGWRVHPIYGSMRFHSGTDIGAPMGTPILAAYTGRVAIADFMQGYGLTVVMQHNDGTQETVYAHMSEIFVRPGESVKQGEVIGRVGSTGNSTGPHLHFEFREKTPQGWVARNPSEMLEVALANFFNPNQSDDPEINAMLLALKDISKASSIAGTAFSAIEKNPSVIKGPTETRAKASEEYK